MHDRLTPHREPLWPYLLGLLIFAAITRLGLANQSRQAFGILADWPPLPLLLMLVFKGLKLPVHVIRGGRQRLRRLPAAVQRFLLRLHAPFSGETAVVVSLGGLLIPLCVEIYLVAHGTPNALQLFNASVMAVGILELLRLALIHAGVLSSVGMLAPLVALLLGWTLNLQDRTVLVSVSGFTAILVSGELPSLSDLRTIGASEVVLGGDENFSALFLNYFVSTLFT